MITPEDHALIARLLWVEYDTTGNPAAIKALTNLRDWLEDEYGLTAVFQGCTVAFPCNHCTICRRD